MDRRKPTMIVVYNDGVYDELRNIWLYNAERRSVEHATDYEDFLIAGMDALADSYHQGRSIDGFPRLRSIAFRRNPRGDGHVAVYEVDRDKGTINVLHVFHTKQSLAGRLSRDR